MRSKTTRTLRAKQDYLKNIASTRDPVKALAEFVWSALDGHATMVALANFDSWHSRSLTTHRTPGRRAIYGKEGRGSELVSV